MLRKIDDRPTVTIWDGETMKFHGQISCNRAIAEADQDSRSVTLPLDDEIAQWLIADSRRTAHLTVDEHDGRGRWAGRLDHWQIDRVGPCEKCPHCTQKQLTAVWVA